MSYIELIEAHTKDLVKEIKKGKEVPKDRKIRFSDGVSMCDFYRTIVEMGHKGKFIDKKFDMDELERLKKCLKDIKNALEKCNSDCLEYKDIEESIQKRHDAYIANVCNVRNLININATEFITNLNKGTEEVIELIYKLKRLPRYNETTLTNNVDARRFVAGIYDIYEENRTIDKKTKIERLDDVRQSLIKINEALVNTNNKEYTGEASDDDRVEDIVNYIYSNSRLPYGEYFEDGTSMMSFYKNVEYKNNRILLKGMSLPGDETVPAYWEKMEWMRYFTKYRTYYNSHKDRYLTYSKDSKLKKWYMKQVDNYYKSNKTCEQIQNEELLNDVCIKWMGSSTYLFDEDEKSLHLYKNMI